MFGCQRHWLVAVLAMLVGSLGAARGAEEGEGGDIAPQAKQVVEQFGKFIHDLKSFSLLAKGNLHVEAQGQKQDISFSQELRVERPNKIFIQVDSSQPGGGVTIAANGEELTTFIQPVNKYVVEESPVDLTALFENPVIAGITSAGNASAITQTFFVDDPVGKLLEKVTTLEYVGEVKLDGKPAHHLKAQSEQLDWELWIAAGKEPLPLKFVPNLEKALAKMNRGGAAPQMKVENVVTFTDWNIQPKFDAESFAFTPPADAEKVDSLMEMFGQRAQPDAQKLVGEPAPEFEMATLDGGTASVAEQKNKNVVILDFWATWCGPCREAMPIINKVAKAFADKGVVFYAVNIDEEPEKIKEFLEAEKLELAVALDKGGEVAQKYLANAIPQTVIIGKDGRVQVVHVGLSANLEETLTEELTALVDGKDLAAEKKKPADEETAAEGDAEPAPEDTDSKPKAKLKIKKSPK
jgi:peroxiredoxin